MLKDLKEKGDSVQDQTVHFIRELETIRMNQMEMLEIKNTITKMKNALNGSICRFDTDKQRFSNLKIGKYKLHKLKRKKKKEQNSTVLIQM